MDDSLTKQYVESLGFDFKFKRVTSVKDAHPLDYCCMGKLVDGSYFFVTVDDQIIKTKAQLIKYINDYGK